MQTLSKCKHSPYNVFQKFAGNCRHVHTFGVGHVHDSTLLDEISTAGNGHYYYIDSGEKVYNEPITCSEYDKYDVYKYVFKLERDII